MKMGPSYLKILFMITDNTKFAFVNKDSLKELEKVIIFFNLCAL